VEGELGFTVGGVWNKFFATHPDLVRLRLYLFNVDGGTFGNYGAAIQVGSGESGSGG
jgi:hypothetical protein